MTLTSHKRGKANKPPESSAVNGGELVWTLQLPCLTSSIKRSVLLTEEVSLAQAQFFSVINPIEVHGASVLMLQTSRCACVTRVYQLI